MKKINNYCLHIYTENIVLVDLKPNIQPDFHRVERHFYTTSSFGVYSKTSIEVIQAQNFPMLPYYISKVPQQL